MKTRVMGISGSPRMSSNSSTLVEIALQAAEEAGAKTEFIELTDLDIGACEHCSECSKLGRCKLDDDLNKVADIMKVADAIIFGSPDHYASVSTTMKNLMDRTGRFLHLEGKIGAGIVVGRRSGMDLALTHIQFFMFVKEMIIPGSVNWPVGFALNPGDIRADTEAISMATQLGNRVATLASILVRNPVPWSHEPRPLDEKARFGDEWRE